MKHHGNYIVDTPEEILLNLCVNSEEGMAYANTSLQKIKKQYHNNKRHKEKRGKYAKRKKYKIKS